MSDGYLADTSVFIAAEQGRPLGLPPGGTARISVATLTELIVGAQVATGSTAKDRAITLARGRSFVALPLDEPVAEHLAGLLVAAKQARRRVGAMDAIIAATALAHDLVIWSQDGDFDALAELEPALRIHRG